MRYVEHMCRWVEAQREALDRRGRVQLSVTPNDRLKRAVHFAVSSEDAGWVVELIVWESGEAEFSFGTFGSMSSEHHDLVDIGGLDALLGRLLANVEILGR